MGCGTGVGAGVGVGVGAGVGVGGTGTGVGMGTTGGTDVCPCTDTLIRLAAKPPGWAVKPNSTVPPAGMVPFQAAGWTTLLFPLRETMAAFQIEEMVAGMVNVTDQLLIGAPLVLRRTTAPVSPEPQSLSMRVVAVMAAFGVDGGGVMTGGGTGVGAGVGLGAGLWPVTATLMRFAAKPPGLAVKPNSTVPPAGILAVQAAGLTTLLFPRRETMAAFQIEEMVAGMVKVTDQLLTGAAPVLRNTTVPVSPEPQSLSIRVVAVMVAEALWPCSRMAAAAMTIFRRKVEVIPAL